MQSVDGKAYVFVALEEDLFEAAPGRGRAAPGGRNHDRRRPARRREGRRQPRASP
ncbi:MAG: hypothetical protein MZW92_00920 [Comamonadaceae bacterium]|nr:hypothetical protein [Comamonadaceae bacterium]